MSIFALSALRGSNWTSMKKVFDEKKICPATPKFCGWSYSSLCTCGNAKPAGCDKPTHAPRWYKPPSVEKTSLELD